MASVNTSIEIDAPVQRVWDLATDIERLGDWVSIHRGFPTPPPAKVEQGTSGPAGTTARTTYLLAATNGGTRFAYQNEFKLPFGELGEAASAVISGHAEREADGSLACLNQLAEG